MKQLLPNMRMLLAAGITGFVAVITLQSIWLMLVIACIGASVPYLWQRRVEKSYRRRMARLLRESLQGMVSGLRAGNGFLQALEYTAQETSEPIQTEWRRVLTGVEAGQPLRQALDDLRARIPVDEINWFVTVVQVTQATGGSLAGVLETLATTLSEKETLREKVEALTAQGKASGALLSALPFLLIIVLSFMMPEFMSPFLRGEQGQSILAGVIVSISIGSVFIFKIVNLEEVA